MGTPARRLLDQRQQRRRRNSLPYRATTTPSACPGQRNRLACLDDGGCSAVSMFEFTRETVAKPATMIAADKATATILE
jgi:hypothetical protein